jgi:DNA polymerase III delta subunit
VPRFVVIAHDPLIAEEAARSYFPDSEPVERYWGFELSIDAILGHLGSLDLFSSARYLHYVDFLDYKPKKADGLRFAELLGRLPAEITLVCSQSIEDATRSEEERLLAGADFKRVADGAKVEDLRKLADGEAGERWLRQRALSSYALALTAPQVQRLLSLSGGKLSLADGELKKLALLKSVSQPQPIPDALFEATVSSNPAAHFYGLIDAVLSDSPAAQRLLLEWHSLEPEGFRLLSELRRHFLGLYALSKGERVMPPYFGNQLQRHTRRWQGRRLALAVEQLAELEYGLKSGRYPGASSREAELGALQVAVAQLAAR